MCPIRNSIITTVRKPNAFWHYSIHKNHNYGLLEGEARKSSLKKMKLKISASEKYFRQCLRKGQTLLKQRME